MKHEVNGESYTLSQLKTKLTNIVKANLGKELTGEDYVFAHWALKQRRPGLKGQPKIRAVEDKSGRHLQYFNGANWEDFSYYKACTGKKSQDNSNRYKAFRFEVYTQTRAFRDKEIQRPANRELLKLHEQDNKSVHVDHVIPFHLLLADFLAIAGVKLEDVEIKKHERLNTFTIVDRKLAESWQEFHKKHATLKLLAATDNLDKAHFYDLPLWRYKQAVGNQAWFS